MREIKFRAWDRRNKRMWWNVQNAYDTLEVHHSPNQEDEKWNDLSDEFMPHSFGACLGDEDYEVMQFTGLKDKNGKEIYEGDVVKYGDVNAEIVFEELCFSLKMPWGYGGIPRKLVEVIGNIYENPELLKEK